MKYLKIIFFYLIFIFILNLITSVLQYFNILSNIVKIINFIITYFFTGLYIGKISKEKALIEGIKYSIIIVIFSILLNILLPNYSLSLNNFCYYLFSSILMIIGSIIGINIKKKKNT